MTTSKRFFFLTLTVGLFLALGSSMALAEEKPIKVGLIDPYTGAAAAWGKPALIGWQMVIDEFNAKGGLKGRKIELIIRDDKFKADEALAHARELLLKERVDFLAGTTSSSSSLAVSEFAKSKEKLFIVHLSRSHRITEDKGHKYVFRGAPSSTIEGQAGGYYGATMPYKRWYIIGDDYEYGHSIADNFWKGLSKNKPDVEKIGEAWPKLNETDYISYLTAMIAQKPDAIFAAFGASGAVPFTKQAKLFGLFEKIPIFAFGLADSIFPKALENSMPTGFYAGSNYLWYYPDSPANKNFVKNYLDYTGKMGSPDPYPGLSAYGGYVSAKFLVEAIVKADSVDTEKVIKALEGLTIDTSIGPITMRACDHQAVTPVYWGKLENVSGYPFPIIKNVVMTPADKVIPTCEEVAAAREKAKSEK